MAYRDRAGAEAQEAVAGVSSVPLWLDVPDRPEALVGDLPPSVDLVVVGGGFTGLWTAILAKQRDPSTSVLLLEGSRIAEGASGRNGGFVSASLTHGLLNGLSRWPDDMPSLLRMGHVNLASIESFIAEHGIDCDFQRAGELNVAVQDHEIAGLREWADAGTILGEEVELLTGDQVRTIVATPLAKAGLLDSRGTALVDPARLAWGLCQAAMEMGVVVRERTPVASIVNSGNQVEVHTTRGVTRARRVALATNAYPALLGRLQHYIAPVYDYCLATEPLTASQWQSIGWDDRQGLADAGNRFHYFRPTADGRILWGGYDAVHHRSPQFDRRYEADRSHLPRIAEHFFQFFPQLSGLRFTHGWGGAIDTCSRFTAFWGTAYSGKVTYCLGFTGLGVGASRFGAQTMLDLLDGLDTERTRLDMVRSKPIPFPPEPLRSAGINLTTASIARADVTGKRNLWLRTLDALGMGFDS